MWDLIKNILKTNGKETKMEDRNRQLVKAALARALWHSGPGRGASTADGYQDAKPEMMQQAERVLVFMEKQGISMTSMDA